MLYYPDWLILFLIVDFAIFYIMRSKIYKNVKKKLFYVRFNFEGDRKKNWQKKTWLIANGVKNYDFINYYYHALRTDGDLMLFHQKFQ